MKRRNRFFLALIAIAVLCVGYAVRGTLLQPPASNTWAPAPGALAQARTGAAAAALPDGRILFTGGDPLLAGSTPLATAEFFNPDGSFSAAPAMNYARSKHTASVLPDGRVLVAGGMDATGNATHTAELFDPVANSWTDAGPLMVPRSGHTASLLQDGHVILAGGENAGAPLNSLEIFDPTTNSFTAATGVLSSARKNHAAAVLQDGRILVMGGFDGTNVLATSDLYDPSTGQIVAGPALAVARQQHSATTLLDGTVLIAGGNTVAQDGSSQDLASAELYNPASGSFLPVTATLATPRSAHLAFLLPHNNSVLIVGGTSGGTPVSGAELFMPWTSSFSATGSMATARVGAAGSALFQMVQGGPVGIDGLLVVAGGCSGGVSTAGCDSPLASAEAYGFATVKTDQADYAPGTTVTVTGSGWQPGETVTLTFLESPNIDTHGPWTAVADANGNIVNTDFVPDAHDLDIRFYLTATGSVSQAQTTFLDGPASNGDGTMTVSPTNATAGSTGNTLTFTFTGRSGKDFAAGSIVTVTIPSGWSALNPPTRQARDTSVCRRAVAARASHQSLAR